MRVLLVADTTDNWPDTIATVARAADLVLSLGGLQASDLARLTENTDTPSYGVYGDHGVPGSLEAAGFADLSGGGIAAWTDLGPMTVLGVSGCAQHQWNPEQYAEALDEMPAADWVVTHCPPRGCNDQEDPAQSGIDALTEYVVRHKPKYLFHGHTPPEHPVRKLASTRVRSVHGWSALRLLELTRGGPVSQL